MSDTDGTNSVTRQNASFSSSMMMGVLPFAISRGFSLEEISEEFSISPSDLFSVNARLPEDLFPRMWLKLRERCPGEPLPILLAKSAPFSAMAGLAHVAQHAETLHQAINLFSDYDSIMADRADIHLIEEGDRAIFCVGHPLDEVDNGMAAQAGLALFWRLVRQLLELDVGLLAVELKHNCTGPKSAYEHFFNAEILERGSRTALIFKRSDLDNPIHHGCIALFEYATSYLRQVLEQIKTEWPESKFSKLQTAIAKNAEHGTFDPGSAASAAGMSLRSAQRIAAERNVSIVELINNVRSNMAKELLLKPGVTTEMVGGVLGYSDARAFRRAFKRWTGFTPSSYRSK